MWTPSKSLQILSHFQEPETCDPTFNLHLNGCFLFSSWNSHPLLKLMEGVSLAQIELLILVLCHNFSRHVLAVYTNGVERISLLQEKPKRINLSNSSETINFLFSVLYFLYLKKSQPKNCSPPLSPPF